MKKAITILCLLAPLALMAQNTLVSKPTNSTPTPFMQYKQVNFGAIENNAALNYQRNEKIGEKRQNNGNNLLQFPIVQDNQQYIAYLQARAQQGDSEAQFKLGEIHLWGKYGQLSDLFFAVHYYKEIVQNAELKDTLVQKYAQSRIQQIINIQKGLTQN